MTERQHEVSHGVREAEAKCARHTPEPWKVESDPHFNGGRQLAVWTDKGPGHGLVAHVAPHCPPMDGPALEQKEADARRIVACVNFLAGVSSEEINRLEKLGLDGPKLIATALESI